ncbi:hypothetical protein ACTQ4Q_07455 [Bacillota bacterium LCP21S3_D9]
MINKTFWESVASEWKKPDDGIKIPELDTGGAGDINTDDDPLGDITDLDMDDILADFDI